MTDIIPRLGLDDDSQEGIARLYVIEKILEAYHDCPTIRDNPEFVPDKLNRDLYIDQDMRIGPTRVESHPQQDCVSLQAVALNSYDSDTSTFTYQSNSVGTPTLVRYTIDFVDASQVNNSRQIVVEWDDHTDTTPTVTDTRGLLTAGQITGTGASWSFVAGASNDVNVSSNGTMTLTLLVEDAASNSSNHSPSALSLAGVVKFLFGHDGTGGTGSALDPVVTAATTSFKAVWNPNGDGTDTAISNAPTITLTQGAQSGGWCEVVPWATTSLIFDSDALSGPVPDLSLLPALTDASFMFNACSGLTGTPDLTDLTALTNAFVMFSGCSGLTGTPDLTSLTALTNASYMFDGCSALTGTPDLTDLTTLTNASFMFSGCSGLTGTPDLTSLTALTNAFVMFSGCSGLTGLTPGTIPLVSDWTDTFTGTDIAATDIDTWLIAIDNNFTGTPGTIAYSTMVSNQHLDSARSGAANTSVSQLITDGWTRVGSY